MNKEQLRTKIITEEQTIASRRRFGLFSQPPPLAVGDDSGYNKANLKKGNNGKPVTQPRNILAGPTKSGVTKSSYFDNPSSIYVNDPYSNEEKRNQQYFKSMHTKSAFHQKQFRPNSSIKTLATPAYEYKPESSGKTKFPTKDESGKVKTKQRNIITNPMGKVEKDLMKYPKYMPDPYNRKQILEKQQKKNKKMKMPQAIFQSMSFGSKIFTKDKIAYGISEKSKSLEKVKLINKKQSNHCIHDSPFKPAIKGNRDPIGRYPKSLGSQSAVFQRKKIPENQHLNKQSWKPTKQTLSKPSPSIALNKRNIGIIRIR